MYTILSIADWNEEKVNRWEIIERISAKQPWITTGSRFIHQQIVWYRQSWCDRSNICFLWIIWRSRPSVVVLVSLVVARLRHLRISSSASVLSHSILELGTPTFPWRVSHRFEHSILSSCLSMAWGGSCCWTPSLVFDDWHVFVEIMSTGGRSLQNWEHFLGIGDGQTIQETRESAFLVVMMSWGKP